MRHCNNILSGPVMLVVRGRVGFGINLGFGLDISALRVGRLGENVPVPC